MSKRLDRWGRLFLMPAGVFLAVVLALVGSAMDLGAAQAAGDALPVASVGDSVLENRLNRVLGQIEDFANVKATVSEGVVVLTGEVETAAAKENVKQLVSRFEGVLYVVNQVEQRLEIETRLTPALEKVRQFWDKGLEYLPLIGISLLLIILFWLVAFILTKWEVLYRWLGGETLLGNLIRQVLRMVLLLMGLLLALEILDLTSLMGALLGTAGLFGLALGFAFRDIVENYLAGALLSIKSPFRLNDFVSIGPDQGVIVRFNSRELVLMTLDGNHLRIPNATVYKNVIRNYTSNPRRRFQFSLGVGMDERLLEVQEVGLRTLNAMPGVMDNPPPTMLVEQVGDFSMVISFFGWVDQRQADFLKVRSEAMRLVKRAFDQAGIEMPQPSQTVHLLQAPREERHAPADLAAMEDEARKADVAVVHQLDQQIEEDQAASREKNLLPTDKGRG
ncbi:MAG: mechanosensitive ion channel domain-containing protein [Desulfohalobiaceae bacterium]